MPRSADQLLSDALDLLGSVMPEVPGSNRPDHKWIEELERRARAATSGSPGLSWPEVRTEIESKLGRTS